MADIVPTEQVLQQTRGFRWDAVPSTPERRANFAAEAAGAAGAAPAEADLGGIAGFAGTFKGNGLNTIFRPQDFAVSPTPLPNPASGPADNILEINLTQETLSFSAPLGSIPNRGMVQGDISLNGIPYLQTIEDISDPANPVGIHFEPGVWLSVPATTDPDVNVASVVRMASIPHGTTIEAQGTSLVLNGGPQIDPVDITPFITDPTPPTPPQFIKFPSQTAADTGTFRLPQDLTSFIAAGTITQDILDNPNVVLKNRADAQNIIATTVIAISTIPKPPLFGGGTTNIAFLLGNQDASIPNANAVQMSATFWVETVMETITVPASTGKQPVIISGAANAGEPVVSYSVTAMTPSTEETVAEVWYTQIQYTQTVLLNFNGLTWPHVSVATLVPNEPVPVALTT
jgi:hypothetical protein